jgi:hypothetical protein
MQRAANARWAPLGIGAGCGLVGGLVGVVQWVLTLHDLAERWANFSAKQRRYPGPWEGAYLITDNLWFWVGTAIAAGVVMLLLCWLAAFLASLTSMRRQDGVTAAWVSAIVSSAVYVAATHVAVATSVDPGMTQAAVLCAVPYGILFFSMVLLLASAGAGTGVSTGESLSRRRRAE